MSVPRSDPWFGLPAPEHAVAAWGARAITTGHTVDLVHDRRQCDPTCLGPDKPALHAELHHALDHHLIPLLSKRLKDRDPALQGNSYEQTELQHGRVKLVACPNASHGYLYIVAYIEGPPA